MRTWVIAALACAGLNAAGIRGVVIEHQTGRPLAHALVVVQPVPGTPGKAVSARTGVSGLFEFPSLPGGAYLVTASRRGFAPVEYGQKRWQSPGVPVVLDETESYRLRRWNPPSTLITWPVE